MKAHSRSRCAGSSDADGSSSSTSERVAEQPDRDVQPLPVAAGELAGLLVAAELGQLEHPRDPLRRRLLEPREQLQVLAHGQLRVDRGALRDPARGRQVDLALVGRQAAREDLQQRRLAGAVGPDDRHPLAGLEAEGDVAQRGLGPEALADPRRPSSGRGRGRRGRRVAIAELGPARGALLRVRGARARRTPGSASASWAAAARPGGPSAGSGCGGAGRRSSRAGSPRSAAR